MRISPLARAGVALALVAILTSPDALRAQLLGVGSGGGPIASNYNGTISWTYTLQGPAYRMTETATVLVTAGKAACNGAIQTTGVPTVSMFGPGLLEIEFDKGEAGTPLAGRQVYTVKVACPRQPQPARWSSMMESYDQPTEDLKLDRRTSRVTPPAVLKGQWTIPAPEEDALNGVTGSVTFSWNLCTGCTPPPRPAAN